MCQNLIINVISSEVEISHPLFDKCSSFAYGIFRFRFTSHKMTFINVIFKFLKEYLFANAFWRKNCTQHKKWELLTEKYDMLIRANEYE